MSNAVAVKKYLEIIINLNELCVNTRLKIVVSIDYSHCRHEFHLQTKQTSQIPSVVIINYIPLIYIIPFFFLDRCSGRPRCCDFEGTHS